MAKLRSIIAKTPIETPNILKCFSHNCEIRGFRLKVKIPSSREEHLREERLLWNILFG